MTHLQPKESPLHLRTTAAAEPLPNKAHHLHPLCVRESQQAMVVRVQLHHNSHLRPQLHQQIQPLGHHLVEYLQDTLIVQDVLKRYPERTHGHEGSARDVTGFEELQEAVKGAQ